MLTKLTFKHIDLQGNTIELPCRMSSNPLDFTSNDPIFSIEYFVHMTWWNATLEIMTKHLTEYFFSIYTHVVRPANLLEMSKEHFLGVHIMSPICDTQVITVRQKLPDTPIDTRSAERNLRNNLSNRLATTIALELIK